MNMKVFREMMRNTIRLFGIVWRERRRQTLALSAVFLLLSFSPFLLSGSRGLLINELVRSAGVGSVSGQTAALVIIMILASVIPTILYALEYYLGRMKWFFLEEKFELMLLEKRGEIDVASHEDPRLRDLIAKTEENGVWRIQSFFDRQYYIFQNAIEVVIASLILFSAKWWVFAAIIVGTLPELAVEARYGHNVWGIHSGKAETRRRHWDLKSHFVDLPKLIELKLFQNTRHFYLLIQDLFRSFRDEEKKNDAKNLKERFVALFFSQAAIGLSTIWFVYEVVRGNIGVGTLTFILASIADLRQALSGLFSNLGKQYQDSLFVSDLFKMIDIPPMIKKPVRGVRLDTDATPEIVFENVSFSYPNSTRPVLKNFSLTIEPGEKVAFVGVNGAGKTTIVKLLIRFYDPTKGRILVGGRDLREIDIESWYSMIGALFQDYAQYHFFVKEAIALGRVGGVPTLRKVTDAAKAAEADIFITEWEKAYETMLGKQYSGGIEPSIGQWQKLGLARTFYRDPRILILDEPTASIDAEAEQKIFEKVEALSSDRTVILISHRFSTVRRANRICVIKGGLLAELGSHDELVKLNGTYARLFKLQAKGYK